jgi:hypothetical protein
MNSQPKISHQLIIRIENNPIVFESRKALVDYLNEQRMQGDWQKFDHLPLLKIIDMQDDEFITYANIGKLPYVAQSKDQYIVKSPKSKRPLIIIKK